MATTTAQTTTARVRRWWTEQEDAVLREEAQAQLNAGALKDWNRIAERLPGRTNKDCRKRWSKVCEQVNKGTWTTDEDKRLEAAVLLYGSKWTHIAAAVGTRHSDQCAKRWQHSLDPSLDHREWTEEDDKRLLDAVAVSGRNWKAIGTKSFPARSATDIKNRYVMIDRRRKQKRESRQNSSASASDMEPFTDDANANNFSFATPPMSNAGSQSPMRSHDGDRPHMPIEDTDMGGIDLSRQASSHQSHHSASHSLRGGSPAELQFASNPEVYKPAHFDPMQQLNTPIAAAPNADPFSQLHFSTFDNTAAAQGHLIQYAHSQGPYSAVIEPEQAWSEMAQPQPPSGPPTSWPVDEYAAAAPFGAPPTPPAQEWMIGGNDVEGQMGQLGEGMDMSKMVLVLEGVEMETVSGVISTLVNNKRRVRMRLFTSTD